MTPVGESVRAHHMPFGATVEDGHVRFRLWAPALDALAIEISGVEGPLPMQRLADGWFELVTDRARAGTNYRYRLPDGLRVPDPASRHQPVDVHGPSQVVDPSKYRWRDHYWRGRPWHEAVVYELHVGTFTPEGTFGAIIGKLDHLVALGVTAIELMPVAEFAGTRNWGYDGVLPYAPDRSYGQPDDLKDLVQAAHERGLMVLLDVVYNHLGPEGNYLHRYAPQFFTERHHTPWGAAMNFDGSDSGPVREFFAHNALYWIEEFHLDGLRLDAVQTILDDSPRHILAEIAERVQAAVPERTVHLVLENGDNEAEWLVRSRTGHPRWYAAQWNDDVHHTLHVALTGERGGYYADFGDTTKLGRSLAEGFVFQGEFASFWNARRGEPSAHLPPGAFVAFLQNHDQIGNRAFGERIHHIAAPEAVRAAAAVYLLLPQVPMLFMGEEWAAPQPFLFFADFAGDLAEAVRNGRRNEFARFEEFADPARRARIPDPLAEQTYLQSKLDWDDRTKTPNDAWLDWYRRILLVREVNLVPLLPRIKQGGVFEVRGDGIVHVWWRFGGGTLDLAANLSAEARQGFPPPRGQVLWTEGEVSPTQVAGPWAVRWSIDA